MSLKLEHSPTHPQQEAEVSTYFIAELEVTNPAGYEPYRAAVPATIAQYDGRYLTRGAAAELVEGGPAPKRVVILEFADAAAVKRWYHSPEYQKIRRSGSLTRPAALLSSTALADSPRPAAPHRPACEVGPEILTGVALLAGGDVFRSPGRDNIAAGVAALGAEVDDPVSGLDDLEIVLDDQHGVAGLD